MIYLNLTEISQMAPSTAKIDSTIEHRSQEWHSSHNSRTKSRTGLGRLWHSQGKSTEARDLLAPIYGWFTEGFDTADCAVGAVLTVEVAGPSPIVCRLTAKTGPTSPRLRTSVKACLR